MSIFKKFNIMIIAVVSIISLNLSIPLINNVASAQETKETSAVNENKTEQKEENTASLENVVQDFKDAYEAIAYAQDKISKNVGYTSEINAVINCGADIFPITIACGLNSKSMVDSEGRVYTVDATNMYKEWLNGQYGIGIYSKKGSDRVYLRETKDVSTDTGIAKFTGDFAVLERAYAEEHYGYLDNSVIVPVRRQDIVKVEQFEKTETGYSLGFKLNRDSADAAKIKFMSCAGLTKKPVIISIYVYFKLDIYGNLLSANYKLSCTGDKPLDFDGVMGISFHGVLNATLSAEFSHTFKYDNPKFNVPTVVKFD